MNRIKALISLKDHPWLRNVWRKITDEEREFCLLFVGETITLSSEDFETKVNRLYMDKKKPKNSNRVQELLSCANTIARTKK